MPTTTPRKLQANRANARLSTGPRTPEGKQRSSRNAITHGFHARDVVIPGEDPADFTALREASWHDCRPRDTFEEVLVDQDPLKDGEPMGEGWLGGLAERLTDEKEFASRLLGHEERLGKLMFAAVGQLRAYRASPLTDRPKFGDRYLFSRRKKGICPRISVSVPESAVPGFRAQAESAARRGACQTARAAARCWAGRTRGS